MLSFLICQRTNKVRFLCCDRDLWLAYLRVGCPARVRCTGKLFAPVFSFGPFQINSIIIIFLSSACTSASLEPSYVLRAIGADDDLAHSSIRFWNQRSSTQALLFCLSCWGLGRVLVLESPVLFAIAPLNRIENISVISINGGAWREPQQSSLLCE